MDDVDELHGEVSAQLVQLPATPWDSNYVDYKQCSTHPNSDVLDLYGTAADRLSVE